METIVKIDGSFGKGGGQIIRTSLSLSALTGKPVEIENVRAKRSRPGLQPQHLTAVQAAARICNAALDGATVGSTRFTFAPSSPVQPGRYEFDIGTAGASTLVMQTVLLPLALAAVEKPISNPSLKGREEKTSPQPSPWKGEGGGRFEPERGQSVVTVSGGTHVPHAPTAQYLMHVYGDLLKEYGLEVAFASPAAGFFPRGGGRVEAEIGASTLQPVDLVERGRLRGVTVYVVTSGLPEHVAQRGASTAEKALAGYRRPQVVKLDLPSRGQGASVIVVADCENVRAGFSSIGERGTPMERVVEECCREFADWYRTGAACEEHLADQLALPMSLTRSTSRWSTSMVSEHLRTVLWVVEKFLPVSTSIEERVDGSGVVEVRPSYAGSGGK